MSKTISEPVVRLAQTVHLLAPTPTLSPNRPKRDSTDPRHLGVPSGAYKMISEPMVCSAQTVHLSCTDTGSQQNETRFHLTHVT